MRARQIVSTVAIAGGLLIAPALPSQAAPTGGCAPAANRPVLAMTLNPTSVRGNAATAVTGSFKQNSCGIGSAKIHLQTRPLVNGKPAGTWKTVSVVDDGFEGPLEGESRAGSQRARPCVLLQGGGFPTVFSSAQSLMDAIRITMHPSTLSGCKIHLTGATTPVQANRKVLVQQRGAKGAFQGWFTIGSTKTHSDGTYSTTAAATCGNTYNLSVHIASSATNAAGRSGTTFGIHRTRKPLAAFVSPADATGGCCARSKTGSALCRASRPTQAPGGARYARGDGPSVVAAARFG